MNGLLTMWKWNSPGFLSERGLRGCPEGVRFSSDSRPADQPGGELREPAACWYRRLAVRCFLRDCHSAGAPPPLPAARHWGWWDCLYGGTAGRNWHQSWMFVFVPAGLDVAAITKLVVETVREGDDGEFTHHNQTLEMGTTKVYEI